MASSINKKSAYAGAAVVAGYLLTFKISRPETDVRGPVGSVALFLIVALPVGAIVLAILGLREIRANKRASRPGLDAQGAWVAIASLLLAVAFVGLFGFQFASRWRHNTSIQKTSGSPTWTRFTSKSGDFSVLFPLAPFESTDFEERPGGPVTVYMVQAPGDGDLDTRYCVMSDPLPNDGEKGATAVLDRLEADYVKHKGPVRARAEVSVGRALGRELRFDLAENSISLRIRIFTMNQRVYRLLVKRPLNADENSLDVRFLDSFSLQGS